MTDMNKTLAFAYCLRSIGTCLVRLLNKIMPEEWDLSKELNGKESISFSSGSHGHKDGQ